VIPRKDADLLTARDIQRNINAATKRVITSIEDFQRYQSLPVEQLRAFVNFHTLSAAIRADVFRDIPFRQADFAEDLIWGKEALEAGYRIQFEPTSVAYHSHNYSLIDVLRRNFDDGAAGRRIVNRELLQENVAGSILRMVRDDWRFLEDECGLHANELENWHLISASRRTAQVLGQWLGINYHDSTDDLLRLLSITEHIRCGAKTETPDSWGVACA
jgi:rhamnosyltransferase